MALNGMFVEAASVTADQQWRNDTSAEWRDGPINLGAVRFQPTQIVEVRDRFWLRNFCVVGRRRTEHLERDGVALVLGLFRLGILC